MPFEGFSIALPDHPLEVVALVLILDALALLALVVFDTVLRRADRKHHRGGLPWVS